MKLDSVIVGHATVDINVLPHGVIENILGGAPTYTGFAITSLGKEAGIVSKIGSDFPEQFPPLFSKFGLNTEGILTTSGKTTKFENTYEDDGSRKQVCRESADKIEPGDLPQAYMNADSFYVSPVMDEVPSETLAKITEESDLAMLDPQGLFRELHESGEVEMKVPDDLEKYLGMVDIVKLGKDEYEVFDRPEDEVLKELSDMGPEICIITLGEKGCKMLVDGDLTHIESLNVDVQDLTGAGDVFGAAFLSRYMDTGSPIKSARFGNAAAGLKIEYKGPTGFPSEDEVLEAVKERY